MRTSNHLKISNVLSLKIRAKSQARKFLQNIRNTYKDKNGKADMSDQGQVYNQFLT
jgi:hypothetical protein